MMLMLQNNKRKDPLFQGSFLYYAGILPDNNKLQVDSGADAMRSVKRISSTVRIIYC